MSIAFRSLFLKASSTIQHLGKLLLLCFVILRAPLIANETPLCPPKVLSVPSNPFLATGQAMWHAAWSLTSLSQAVHFAKPEAILQGSFPFLTSTVLNVPSSMSESGLIKLIFFKQPLSAPLAIYLPGMFADPSNPASLSGAARLLSLGYHVLILPNPWSASVQLADSFSKPLDLDREAEALAEVLRRAFISIPEQFFSQKLKQIDAVYGESYGAILGPALVVKLQNDGCLAQGLKTLFISPPYSLEDTIRNVDQLIDESYDVYFRNECQTNPLGLAATLLSSALPQALVSEFATECAKALFAIEYCHKNLSRLDSGIRHVETFSKKWTSHVYKDLRFRDYVLRHTNAENLNKVQSRANSLRYWLEPLVSNKQILLQVLLSEDDFINSKGVWLGEDKTFFAGLGKQFLLFPNGGHLGIVASPEFGKFFYDYFRKKIDIPF